VKIGICQVDGKWPNLALAKIAAWHRAQGDDVEHFMPLATYDRVYASKVFTDTPENPYVANNPDVWIGGTGYSIGSSLSAEKEAMRPDFSLWPSWHKSMGFTTRGCPRHCPFCVVPEKEGKIHVVAEFGDVWDGKSSEVVFLDNNVTAAPIDHLLHIAMDAKNADVAVDFCQGFDVRLWTEEHNRIVHDYPVFRRRVHFAFDSLVIEPYVRRVVRTWKELGLHPDRLVFYVLIGFDTTEEDDLYRIEVLRSLGVNPFVMPYDRHDIYQRDLARWCNSVVARKACSFADYRQRLQTTGYRTIDGHPRGQTVVVRERDYSDNCLRLRLASESETTSP
jgi:hypothetical protein